MDDNTITVRTKAANALTDLQQAHADLNAAAVRYTKTHSRADKQAIKAAQEKIYRLEQGYREGRLTRYAKALAGQRRPQ